MLDIKFIRENADLLRETLKKKQIDLDLDRLLKLDDKRRTMIHDHEKLRSQQNDASDAIAKASASERKKLIADMKSVADKAHAFKDQLIELDHEYRALMLQVPQIPSEQSPIGGEEANTVVKKVGEPKTFGFDAKDHIELGNDLDIIDIERGVKLMGTRGYILKNAGAQLELALNQYALDFLRAKGFTQISAPVLAKKEFFEGTGHFPFAEDETFKVYDQKQDREDPPLYLIGTSEVPLCGLHADEIVDLSRLPYKYCAMTNCFRTEVGSYGRDTAGLYRVKQFTKVEQVILMKNDLEAGRLMLQEIMANAEEFLESLEIPYQVLQIATGDMGAGKVEMYDIESWMPSRDSYGETHSASLLGDWQARRLNIRYQDGDEKKFCFTLNNTLIASPRILVALLENHQQENGSIVLPKSLHPYMNGLTVIEKPHA